MQALVLRYNDEEWDHLIDPEPGWSREETDYLLDLCALFDLRWMAIADRYEVGCWSSDLSACFVCIRSVF